MHRGGPHPPPARSGGGNRPLGSAAGPVLIFQFLEVSYIFTQTLLTFTTSQHDYQYFSSKICCTVFCNQVWRCFLKQISEYKAVYCKFHIWQVQKLCLWSIYVYESLSSDEKGYFLLKALLNKQERVFFFHSEQNTSLINFEGKKPPVGSLGGFGRGFTHKMQP